MGHTILVVLIVLRSVSMRHQRKVAPRCSFNRSELTGIKRLLLLTCPKLLSGLFPNFARWLTRSGTSAIEFLNVWAMIGFGSVKLLNELNVVETIGFEYFKPFPPFYPWAAMIIIGIIQGYLFFTKSTPLSDQLGGIFLGGSAIIWFVISGTFGYNYPPLSTAFPIYLGIGILTGSGGYALLNNGKAKEILKVEEGLENTGSQ